MKNLFNLHFQEQRICNLSINMSDIENIIYYGFRSYKFIKDGYIWDDIHQKGDNILGYPIGGQYAIFNIARNRRSAKLRDLVNLNHAFDPTKVKDL